MNTLRFQNLSHLPHTSSVKPTRIDIQLHTKIYLASASPRRSELLTQIQVAHIQLNVPPAPGEDEPRHADESPLSYVQRTASDKADRCIDWMHTGHGSQTEAVPLDRSLYILTADTTVALGDLIFGKPADQKDAKKILTLLSNQTHLVHTAVVLAKGQERLTALSTSKVSFAELSPQDIDQYIASQEPFGKAGAYGIQGMAAKFICQIEGSYSGVMGLPLFETAQLLKKAGVL